jgi:7,8-dihydroneopterin aldolase/epimerase/oxygenase
LFNFSSHYLFSVKSVFKTSRKTLTFPKSPNAFSARKVLLSLRAYRGVMGSVGVRGIRAYGRHGADPGERDHPQPFDIEVELECDLSRARLSDALEDTVNYALVHARVLEIVERTSFVLLERLGEELLRAFLVDPHVLTACVTIAKPKLLGGATPWVRLSSRRGETQGWE